MYLSEVQATDFFIVYKDVLPEYNVGSISFSSPSISPPHLPLHLPLTPSLTSFLILLPFFVIQDFVAEMSTAQTSKQKRKRKEKKNQL